MNAQQVTARPAVTEQGTVEQLDGSYISIRHCTCPELFERYPWIGSVDCPIDWHRTRYTQHTWESEDAEGNAVRTDRKGNEQQRQAGRGRVGKAAMRKCAVAAIDRR